MENLHLTTPRFILWRTILHFWPQSLLPHMSVSAEQESTLPTVLLALQTLNWSFLLEQKPVGLPPRLFCFLGTPMCACSVVSDSATPGASCSTPRSYVRGIIQATLLEWVTISSSGGSSWPRDWTHISHFGRQILHRRATWKAWQTLRHTSFLLDLLLSTPLPEHCVKGSSGDNHGNRKWPVKFQLRLYFFLIWHNPSDIYF